MKSPKIQLGFRRAAGKRARATHLNVVFSVRVESQGRGRVSFISSRREIKLRGDEPSVELVDHENGSNAGENEEERPDEETCSSEGHRAIGEREDRDQGNSSDGKGDSSVEETMNRRKKHGRETLVSCSKEGEGEGAAGERGEGRGGTDGEGHF